MNSVDDTTMKVFRYLDGYIKQHGYPPCRAEFVRFCRVPGDDLNKHFDRLQQAHYIRRGRWNWHRTIYL